LVNVSHLGHEGVAVGGELGVGEEQQITAEKAKEGFEPRFEFWRRLHRRLGKDKGGRVNPLTRFQRRVQL